jgi:hypothetical protein
MSYINVPKCYVTDGGNLRRGIHRYSVSSVDRNGNEIFFDNEVDINVKRDGGIVILHFEPVDDASYYLVYRGGECFPSYDTVFIDSGSEGMQV